MSIRKQKSEWVVYKKKSIILKCNMKGKLPICKIINGHENNPYFIIEEAQ